MTVNIRFNDDLRTERTLDGPWNFDTRDGVIVFECRDIPSDEAPDAFIVPAASVRYVDVTQDNPPVITAELDKLSDELAMARKDRDKLETTNRLLKHAIAFTAGIGIWVAIFQWGMA